MDSDAQFTFFMSFNADSKVKLSNVVVGMEDAVVGKQYVVQIILVIVKLSIQT